MEFVCIEELVPKDHLLRKIDKVIDFEFIREKVKDLYCADNGRPAVDPVVLFKMLFFWLPSLAFVQNGSGCGRFKSTWPTDGSSVTA